MRNERCGRWFALFVGILGLTASAQDVYVNIENEAVRRYMSEVTYTSAADSSRVGQYNMDSPNRLDVPVAALLTLPATDADSVCVSYGLESDLSDGKTIVVRKGQSRVPVYNLIPKLNYCYKVVADGNTVSEGRIHPTGQVRMISVPSVYNVRDLGGWITADNKRVKYGKLFRGSELNGGYIASTDDLQTLRELGIGAEIDLRAYYNEEHGVSAFDFSSNATPPTFLYTSNSGQLPEHLSNPAFQLRWRSAFLFIVNNLRAGRSVYIHCVYGADRTGYLSLLLEGLLGVTYDGLVKDYELTNFFTANHVKSRIEPVFEYMDALVGATLRDKFNFYFTNMLMVSQADIDYFRSEMLVDEKGPSTGIETLHQLTKETHRPHQYFDLTGRKVSPRQRGLLIEMGADGVPRKMLRATERR